MPEQFRKYRARALHAGNRELRRSIDQTLVRLALIRSSAHLDDTIATSDTICISLYKWYGREAMRDNAERYGAGDNR